MPLILAVQVEGRPIRVCDALISLSHVRKLTKAFLAANFVCGEVARPETSQFRHWVLDILLETAAQLVAYQPTLAAVQDFKNGDVYRIYRCYCNHAAYGDMLFTHADAQPGSSRLTALVAHRAGVESRLGWRNVVLQQEYGRGGRRHARARPPRRF